MKTPDNAAALLGPNEVLVSEGVVTADERRMLVDWLVAQQRAGQLLRNPQDPGAYSTPFRAADTGEPTRPAELRAVRRGIAQPIVWLPDLGERVDPLPAELWRIRARVVERLGLDALNDDPYKGSFISYIEPGTGVHQHRDERLIVNGEERPILRCNLFLQRPGAGGLPVFDGRFELDVPDLGMWAFFPTELVHSATAVQGRGFRALLSFGFLGRMTQWWTRRFRAAPSFLAESGLEARGEGVRGALIAQTLASVRAAGINDARLALLAFALRAPGGFNVDEAAGALSMPAAEVWPMIAHLQRSRVLQSRSSERRERGKVWVM
jgi:hypothetical protein